MVKVHPQSNGPQLAPPPRRPPPPRKSCLRFLFQLCFFLVATSFSILLVTVVILALMFGSRREVEVSVTNATLTTFDIKTIKNDTLLVSYDMSFTINITNPNARIAVYYDYVEAYAYYATEPFANVTLSPFYQGHKTTNTLRVVFQGSYETLSFESHDGYLTWFEEEKMSGVYSITVVLSLSVRTKYGKLKYRQNPSLIYCYLQVPLTLSSMKRKSFYVKPFEPTLCDIVHVIT